MALSNELISQFVKVTNDGSKKKSDKIVYGTIVEYDNSKYVKIDGSDLMTPISVSAKVSDGDRVVVTIKNHTAMVTGNTTNLPASSTEVSDLDDKVEGQITKLDDVIANSVTTEYLTATYATIEQLKADYITADTIDAKYVAIVNLEANYATIESLDVLKGYIEELEAENVTINGKLEANEAEIETLTADNAIIKENLLANKAAIGELEAKNVTINGRLDANEADIEDLQTNKLSATDADLVYANIDFANIGQAAIEAFYAKSGLIENIVFEDGYITGKLVGVTISGDLIEGNTIKAEKLVVRGEDGLYYKLNVSSDGTVPEGVSEEELQNGLHGSNIIAQTITADRINVSDLVAFDATIGGFNITEDSIYSGVKETVDNTTRGIYMDNDGQIAFGDASNFIKFYKDTDGTYKLVISASSMTFGATNKNLEEVIEEIKSSADSAQEDIDNLEIGGRNYIRDTRYMDGYTRNNCTIIEGDDDAYVADLGTPTSNAWDHHIAIKPNILYNYVRGKTVTFSMMIRSDAWSANSGDYVWVMFNLFDSSDSTARIWYKDIASNEVVPSSEWKRYSFTVTITDDYFSSGRDAYPDFAVDDSTSFGISVFNYSTSHLQIKQLKLEEGNKATDWTPAPEDVESSISHVEESLREDITANTEKLNSARLEIDSINAMIKSLVTGENGETLMTQTDTGWTFDFSSFQSILNTATENISDLDLDLSDTNSVLETLKQNVTDLGVYTEYIEFGTENGQPCIILGEHDSEFKVVITNTEIRFMEGQTTPAYISNQSLNISKAVISDELQQGGFVWTARSNGNYGLIWKGE